MLYQDVELGIYFLHQYHPYYRGQHPLYNPIVDGRILALKDMDENAINYYYEKLLAELIVCIECLPSICVVPSHNPLQSDSGIKELARRLVNSNYFHDATTAITRTKLIRNHSKCGKRKIEIHLDSMKVNPDEVSNKIVIILDDVATTGNSFLACKKLLLDAGAREVICFALAKNIGKKPNIIQIGSISEVFSFTGAERLCFA